MQSKRECSAGLRNVALAMVYESAVQKVVSNWVDVAHWWQNGINLDSVTIDISLADVVHYGQIAPFVDQGLALDDAELQALQAGRKITLYPDRVVDFEDTHWDFFYSEPL